MVSWNRADNYQLKSGSQSTAKVGLACSQIQISFQKQDAKKVNLVNWQSDQVYIQFVSFKTLSIMLVGWRKTVSKCELDKQSLKLLSACEKSLSSTMKFLWQTCD